MPNFAQFSSLFGQHFLAFAEFFQNLCNMSPLLGMLSVVLTLSLTLWLGEYFIGKIFRLKACPPDQIWERAGLGILLAVLSTIGLVALAIVGEILGILLSGPYYSGPSAVDATGPVIIVGILAGIGTRIIVSAVREGTANKQ